MWLSAAKTTPCRTESLSISCWYWLLPATLSRLLSPVRMDCISRDVISVRSIRKPSMMEIPPSRPWVVTSGIPALHSASMSRLMVRLDTSNFSANSGAVTFSCWRRIDKMPIRRSIFIGRRLLLGMTGGTGLAGGLARRGGTGPAGGLGPAGGT